MTIGHGGRPMTLRECADAEEPTPSPARRPVTATRPQPLQLEMRGCPYCGVLFQPKRERQEFCTRQHGKWYHEDVGTEGVVASVTRLKRGVSVVTHYPDGPAAERAIGLRKGQVTRTVAK